MSFRCLHCGERSLRSRRATVLTHDQQARMTAQPREGQSRRLTRAMSEGTVDGHPPRTGLKVGRWRRDASLAEKEGDQGVPASGCAPWWNSFHRFQA